MDFEELTAEEQTSQVDAQMAKATQVCHRMGDKHMEGRVVISFRRDQALLLAGMLQALAADRDLQPVDELARNLVFGEPYEPTKPRRMSGTTFPIPTGTGGTS